MEVVCFWTIYIYFHLFWTLIENFAAFCRKNIGGHVKTASCVYIGILSRSEFSQLITVFHPFRTMSKKVSSFFQKNFGGVVKRISYVSIETFWWKNLNIQSIKISGIRRENCGFVSKIFSAQPSKLNSRRQYESMKKCKILKKKFITFGHWATSLRPFLKRNNWGCQNNVLPVHRNILKDNFWKKNF